MASLLMNKVKMNQKSSLTKDQAKLKIICDDLCDSIYDLLDAFQIDYRNNSKMISMSCPIHGGDNKSAVNLYPEGERYRGNWKCRTHNCEQIFKSSIIGFIRGILSHNKYGWTKDGDKACSFDEALDFALKFLNKDFNSIKVSKTAKDKQFFSNAITYLTNNPNNASVGPRPSREQIRRSLAIPASYYIDRNYSSEILDKYDIGLCSKPDKEMYNSVVTPIYNNDYQYMIGCSGRSIFEKCKTCSSYHNNQHDCPAEHSRWLFSKWKHSANFKSQNCLYNFWFAKSFIQQSAIAIIVESPGNVWRLEENGIHNSVAMFGSSLSDRQKIILDSSGAMTLIILTDQDDAGRKAAEQISLKCKNTYRIFIPQISKADVAEMTPVEIKEQISDYIESIK